MTQNRSAQPLHNRLLTRRATLQFIASGALSIRASAVFSQNSAVFDHSYAAFDALLVKHVRWLPDNKQSRVDYAGLATQSAALQQVLAEWSAVSPAQFASFSREQRMAFLINAYNGFTLALILTRYPDLKSIKDLGSLFKSPWKSQFFTLLGEPRHLDWIEHEQLRPLYNDPRVHTAVNCASIGCPALRPQAFTATRLQTQLADGMQRFMADRSRNRYNPASGKAEVSAIFKWFREDFEKGHAGFYRLEDVLAFYADALADDAASRDKLRAKSVGITFLDYDWTLNAA